MKIFEPTWYYQNLEQIPLDKLKESGIKVIFCDLDNTLTPAHNDDPVEQSYAFVNRCKEADLKIYLISNNHEPRVKRVATKLKINYFFEAGKPFKNRLGFFFKKHKIHRNECVIIGDQLLTDVWFASRIGIHSILVEPCSSKDLIVTKFNRVIDKILRKRLMKKGKLKGIE